MVKTYFATDVHGSNLVWRKWLSVPMVHKANVLILSGDLTGKVLCPIMKKSADEYICHVFGRLWTLKSSEVMEMIERVSNVGYYPYVCTQDDVLEIQRNPSKGDELIKNFMIQRMEQWLKWLIEKVNVKGVKVIVMPGNDDEKIIDPVIKSFEDQGVIYPLDKVVDLGYNFEMISLDYANLTPWSTPREHPEELLEKVIDNLFSKVKDYSKTICNFHCPPYNTRLDLAPKLDKQLRRVRVMGQPVFVHVGSKAIRKAIERYQPLLGLHGHIHESFASDRIGKTLVLNPGSEYTEGILRGFIIELTERGVDKFWKVEG